MSKIVLKGIPTFRILEYAKSKEFYIDALGFDMDWGHRFGLNEPVYMQISRNGLTLHLSENKRFETGTIVFVDCNALIELYNELSNRKANIELPQPKRTNWKTIQIEIEDPFGNLLRLTRPL